MVFRCLCVRSHPLTHPPTPTPRHHPPNPPPTTGLDDGPWSEPQSPKEGAGSRYAQIRDQPPSPNGGTGLTRRRNRIGDILLFQNPLNRSRPDVQTFAQKCFPLTFDHTCMHTYIRINIHIYIHTYIHTCVHAIFLTLRSQPGVRA